MLIDNFNINDDDFRPIRNKTGDIVYYQISPIHTMLPIISQKKYENYLHVYDAVQFNIGKKSI